MYIGSVDIKDIKEYSISKFYCASATIAGEHKAKKRAYNNYLPVKIFNPFKSVLWSYVSISEKEQKIND